MAANQGDSIHIAQGTYKASNEATLNGEQASYTLVNGEHEGVRILGGYFGEQPNPNLRDINAYPTILDGFLGFDIDGGAARHTRHIFTIVGLLNDGNSDQVFIEGLSIINGKANNPSDTAVDSWGGGALIVNSSVAFLRCKFIDCLATHRGGAIYATDGGDATPGEPDPWARIDVVNCSFISCAARLGGGMHNAHSQAYLANCIFRDCESLPAEANGDGAGLNNYSNPGTRTGYVRMDNCTFHQNTANLAASVRNSQHMTAVNCIFWDGANSFLSPTGSNIIVESCISGNAIAGTNNSMDDPMLDGNSVPFCSSPAVDTGSSLLLVNDRYDLDGDFTPHPPVIHDDEPLSLDRLEQRRIRGVDLDRGAIEVQEPDSCPGDTNDDHVVNVTDLLAVIASWNGCGSPCPADVAPVCGNDGQVNVTDLLLILARWGIACPGGLGTLSGGPPQSVLDCMSECSGVSMDPAKWQECCIQCIEALQQAGVLP